MAALQPHGAFDKHWVPDAAIVTILRPTCTSPSFRFRFRGPSSSHLPFCAFPRPFDDFASHLQMTFISISFQRSVFLQSPFPCSPAVHGHWRHELSIRLVGSIFQCPLMNELSSRRPATLLTPIPRAPLISQRRETAARVSCVPLTRLRPAEIGSGSACYPSRWHAVSARRGSEPTAALSACGL